MAFRKTLSWAVIGFALTGAAYGQVPAPGVADPVILDPVIGAPGIPAQGDPAPGITDGTIIRNGQIKTETATDAPTTEVDAAATAEVPQNSNATTNLNPLGATFDSNTTDRLIIHQGFNNQSDNSGQVSHSAARPIYGMSSNAAHSGGMEANPGYIGGAATYGNNSYPGQACCGGSVHASQCGCGHHHGGHHHGGRRHRRCCR